ncbi:MAG: hypothetical protein IGS49_26010 [Chlorogloeopsis fritschii C42_A2020_084]|jgi:antibiotic biosynthesis monooxygenase (ABM) superfamily enzyme|uniref:hypothetical protein n=1 Tax=Chlorogloeopsis fritschii TaxID=1124 RepID=UPI0019EF6023|nr:hypothetical protein [Chlorogloeopsis fritschii]MBF2008807.1 hypothetical protein [Chlorogloeopsis fritschii C42_A2020_084]
MRGTYSRELYRNRARAIARRTTPHSQPPRYKIFLLTWLAIYPLITGINGKEIIPQR